MKSMVVLFVAALALPAAAFAQDAMMAAPEAGTDMMSPPAKDSGAMMADPKAGSTLRFAAGTGHKVNFTTLKAAQAVAAKGPAVLMFAADWCPRCQADLRQISAEGARLGNITVVVVDYDKAVDLKARYGITYQHTYVQIDAMGKKLAAWSGGGVDGILSHVDRM
jgi:thioredoxin 1